VTQRGKDITPSKGKGFRLNYTRYLEQWGNIEYDSTSLSTSLYLSSFLPSRHGISLTTNSVWAPNNNIPALGTSTTGGNYQATLVGSGNLMRGYPSGVFLGKTLSTANLEYRFPVTWVYDGYGTLPAFLRKIHGAIFFDVVTLDGLFFDEEIGTFRSTKYGNMFYGSGLELRIDLTLGYGLPARINLGLYYGLDERPGGGFSPFVSFTF
jgi:outer membrane protein assembly factor BamA